MKKILIISILFSNLVFSQLKELSEMSFETVKQNYYENKWFTNMLNADNIKTFFNHQKKIESTDYYEKIKEGLVEQSFSFTWNDEVKLKLIFLNDIQEDVNVLIFTCPSICYSSIIERFKNSEELLNSNNLHFILKRGDIKYGWWNMNNGMIYTVEVITSDYFRIIVQQSNIYSKGYIISENDEIMFYKYQ